MDKINAKTEYLNREFKSIKIYQVDSLELQNTVCKIQKILDDFNSRLDMTEERKNELKDRSTENIPTESQREK